MKKIPILLTILILVYLALSIFLFFRDDRTAFNLDQSSVVKEIKSLNRLETASFTIEKIIEAGNDSGAFKDLLFGDRILLIAHVEVIAGFDLSNIDEEDIKITGKKIEIHLPSPEILTTKLDNEKTRVYDRQVGILTKGDSQLESLARLAAEDSIRSAACESGILELASINAKKQLTLLFRSIGFDDVVIEVPAGSCN